jgi:nucleoside 2-deoxyribosyltransferase
MRVYLACTVRGDRGGLVAARAVAARLVALGHEVLTWHLLADGVDDAEAALSETQVFERDRHWLDECDLLVAESSGSSYGVGFEVGYITGRAPQSGQRAIVLFDRSRRSTVSRLVSGFGGVHGEAFAYQSAEEAAAFVAARVSDPGAWTGSAR